MVENLAISIIQTIRESLLILDGGLRVQIANDAFCRTFALAREEVEGSFLTELGGGEWNIPGLLAALGAIIENGVPVESFVVTHAFVGAGEMTLSLNARLIRREAGQIEAGQLPLLLLVIEDISERQLAAEISRMYLEKLEQSNRELQDFAHIASHDLQEPLRAIQSFSERLRTKNAPTLGEQGVDYLDRIEKAATRMRQLITDLLAYSRVTTKNNPLGAVNLNQVVKIVLADLAARLKKSGGRVVVGELPTVSADATQMRQLLQNLIDNSLKFHRKDAPPRVEISSSGVEDGFHSILVSDNGIGFEEKYAERIFSPFERLHSQRDYSGTGIGLAICRKIVERHQGRITAQSVVGEGTVFHIAWPVRPEVLPRISLETAAENRAENRESENRESENRES